MRLELVFKCYAPAWEAKHSPRCGRTTRARIYATGSKRATVLIAEGSEIWHARTEPGTAAARVRAQRIELSAAYVLRGHHEHLRGVKMRDARRVKLRYSAEGSWQCSRHAACTKLQAGSTILGIAARSMHAPLDTIWPAAAEQLAGASPSFAQPGVSGARSSCCSCAHVPHQHTIGPATCPSTSFGAFACCDSGLLLGGT